MSARVVLAAAVLCALLRLGGSHGNLPAVHVLSPLNLGLYNEAGSVPIVVRVSGVDPVAHGTHEVVVRLNIEHEGWRDMLTWPLREATAWAAPHAGAPDEQPPLEFKSVFVDVPIGRHLLEVALRAPPPANMARRAGNSPLPPPSFDTSTHTPFVVRAIPELVPRPGWNSTTCTLLVDTSNVGGVYKRQHLVGFVEGPGQVPVKFEDIVLRHCFIYRVLDVSTPSPVHTARHNQQQGGALLTGIGPIDGDSTSIFSRYSEEIDIPILVNRLCFARREGMDLLFLAGTTSTQLGQSALALKTKGVLASLREYATVVWADMDGVMPLAPRPSSRSCIPFTTCWPRSTTVILPRAPMYPFNPSSAFMIFRRSSLAFAFLGATVHSPSRSSPSEEVVLADAVLSVLHEHGELVYVGQCSRPGATLDCWPAVFAPPSKSSSTSTTAQKAADKAADKGHGAKGDKRSNTKLLQAWPKPIGGIQLAQPWCEVEPSTNFSLVCPCSSSTPPIAGGEAAVSALRPFPRVPCPPAQHCLGNKWQILSRAHAGASSLPLLLKGHWTIVGSVPQKFHSVC